MVKPLFYVDLSEDARDYRHTALEPGLPLLDRQGVNYQILRKWLGDYIAEPEWRNQSTITFYMTDEDRGRLEDVDCYPCHRAEMEKNFAPDLDAIRNKLKKIRAESSTEEMVLRILKKTFAEQTNDLENSDFDSYFFKCRAGKEDWRLVWCCGYQRADLEPLRARLWKLPDGEFLGVRPPDGGKAKKRKRPGPLAVLDSPLALLALLLLLGLFFYAGWPTLKVTPAAWTGPLGSRVEYQVTDHRWLLFKKDVTLRALAESHDPRVIEFGRGPVAETRSIGKTFISFRVGNRFVDTDVEVTQPAPPDSLTIEPDQSVRVAVASTKKLKAIGRYENGVVVDLTTQVTWEERRDKPLLIISSTEKGQIQGDGSGVTKVVASYPVPRKDNTIAEANVDVEVVVADFTSLAVSLQPEKFGVNQTSKIDVKGLDKDGKEYTLTGSTLLKVKVDPTNVAMVDGEYLVGKSEGAGKVNVSYAGLDKALAFTISGRSTSRDLLVAPNEVANAVVHEQIPLNVTAGNDDPIEANSADPKIVEVVRTETENAGYEVWLAAREVGEANVTVTNAGRSKNVKIIVTDGKIETLEFDPPVVALRIPEPKTANLVGTTDSGRRIKVVTDRLSWEKIPRVENVAVDKMTLLLRPLEATDNPQDLQVRLEDRGRRLDLAANAVVEVAGDLLAMDLDNESFGVHPPVPTKGRWIDGGYLGKDTLMYDPDKGGVVINANDPFSPLGTLPSGVRLVEHNGIRLDGLSEGDLLAHFRDYPVAEGDLIRYAGDDGTLRAHLLAGGTMGAIQEVKLYDVSPLAVKDDSFVAELRVYLRQAGEYRLTNATGEGLTEWAACPSDATPVMTSSPIPRNPQDDYELFIERRIADQVKKFQVPFKLEPEAIQRAVVDAVEPVHVGRTVVESDVPVEKRVKRTTRRVIRHTDGASIDTADDAIARTVGIAPRTVSRTTVSSRGTPGSAPDSGSGTAAPGSPAPGAPAPAPGSPAPAPAKPANAPPAPGSDSKAPPAKPAPAPAKPAPAPAKPAPAPGKPAPAPGSDTKAPPGSDSKAQPGVAPATAIPATAQGSDSRNPNNPGGVDLRDPFRASGRIPAGSAARVTTGTATNSPNKESPKKTYEDKDDPKKSPFLDALKNYTKRNK